MAVNMIASIIATVVSELNFRVSDGTDSPELVIDVVTVFEVADGSNEMGFDDTEIGSQEELLVVDVVIAEGNEEVGINVNFGGCCCGDGLWSKGCVESCDNNGVWISRLIVCFSVVAAVNASKALVTLENETLVPS